MKTDTHLNKWATVHAWFTLKGTISSKMIADVTAAVFLELMKSVVISF